MKKFILIVTILISILCIVGCSSINKVDNAKDTEFNKNLAKKPITYAFTFDLKDLGPDCQLLYDNKTYSSDVESLTLSPKNLDETFTILYKDVSLEQNFESYKNDSNIPLMELVNEAKRLSVDILYRYPKAKDISVVIPDGCNIDFRGKLYQGSGQLITLSKVNYSDKIKVHIGDYCKEVDVYLLLTRDNNFDLSNFRCYKDIPKVEINNKLLETEIKNLSDFSLRFQQYGKKNIDIVHNNILYGRLLYDRNYKLRELTLPININSSLSNDSSKYVYVEDSYLVLREYNGDLLARYKLSSKQSYLEESCWSDDNRYVFLSIGSEDKSIDKFCIYDSLYNKLISIGGGQNNYSHNIKWGRENTIVSFFYSSPIHCEDNSGQYVYFDLTNNKLVELGGLYLDKVEITDNEVQLSKYNNGYLLELYNPYTNKYQKEYEGVYDTYYPKDFKGEYLKVLNRENRAEIMSFNIKELFLKNNVEFPSEINRFLPRSHFYKGTDYIYVSNIWNELLNEELVDGKSNKHSHVGLLNVSTGDFLALVNVEDFDYKFLDFVKYFNNNFYFDYDSDSLVFIKDDKILAHNLIYNTIKEYPSKSDICYIKILDNEVVLISDNKLFKSRSNELTKVVSLDTVNNVIENYHDQILVESKDTNNTIYRIISLKDLTNQ